MIFMIKVIEAEALELIDWLIGFVWNLKFKTYLLKDIKCQVQFPEHLISFSFFDEKNVRKFIGTDVTFLTRALGNGLNFLLEYKCNII